MGEKYESVEQMEYKIEEHVNILFNAIEALGEIWKLAGRPYYPAQIVNLGYIII